MSKDIKTPQSPPRYTSSSDSDFEDTKDDSTWTKVKRVPKSIAKKKAGNLSKKEKKT